MSIKERLRGKPLGALKLVAVLLVVWGIWGSVYWLWTVTDWLLELNRAWAGVSIVVTFRGPHMGWPGYYSFAYLRDLFAHLAAPFSPAYLIGGVGVLLQRRWAPRMTVWVSALSFGWLFLLALRFGSHDVASEIFSELPVYVAVAYGMPATLYALVVWFFIRRPDGSFSYHRA